MHHSRPILTHWGAYRVADGADGLTVRPAADDPEPSPIGASLADLGAHPLRLTQPMARAGWLAGRSDGAGRGAEPFVPLDWPTAARLASDALRRTYQTHGAASVYAGSYGWASAGRFHQPQAQLHRLLGLAGGYAGSVGSYSTGAAEVILPHILMPLRALDACQPGWAEIAAHTRLLVAFGGLAGKNAQVSYGGVSRHTAAAGLAAARAAGVRLVSLSPLRDDTPGAEWVPIRPGTDGAVMLAMAQVLLTEGLAATEFLASHCQGADRFAAYLRGEADGVARTPAWAAALSGVPAARIVELARALAAERSLVAVSWSIQRAERGEQPIWLAVALAAMAGAIGQPGGGVAIGLNAMHALGGDRGTVPLAALPATAAPVVRVPVARLADMLLDPGGTCSFNGGSVRYPDVRLIWWAGGNPFHHHQDLGRLVRAWRRPETVIVHETHWTATARHADLVLPAATLLERDDFAAGGGDGAVLAIKRVRPAPGLAESDHLILARIAGELGLRERFTEGRDEEGWLRWLWAESRTRAAAAGIALPEFDAFWAAEAVRPAMPARAPSPLARFRADPATAPLPTPSGRIELFSPTIAAMGLLDCPGVPHWAAPAEWADAPAAALHLVSNQPAGRLHSQLDFGRTSLATKRNGREPCRLHPADAAARGIKDGDAVRLWNARGACYATACLSDAVMPGVAVMATGGWFDPATPGDPAAPCRHGNPNALTRDRGTSGLAQACAAQSCLVAIEPAPDAPAPAPHDPPPTITG